MNIQGGMLDDEPRRPKRKSIKQHFAKILLKLENVLPNHISWSDIGIFLALSTAASSAGGASLFLTKYLSVPIALFLSALTFWATMFVLVAMQDKGIPAIRKLPEVLDRKRTNIRNWAIRILREDQQ